jgi:hypothetical protein
VILTEIAQSKHKILRSPFFLDGNGPFGLAFLLCDSRRRELTLPILLHLLHLLMNLNMSGSGLLFLLALLSKLVIPNVTINCVRELVELVQLFNRIFHEMEEPAKVGQLRNDLKPQVVRLGSD